LDQPAFNHPRPSAVHRCIIAAVLASALMAGPAVAQSQDAPSRVAPGTGGTAAGDALAAAQAAFSSGQTQAALETLRNLRSVFPDSPLVPESLRLSVEYALASGDEYTSRYLLKRLRMAAPGSPAAFASCLTLARHYEQKREWLAALEFYTSAAESFRVGVTGGRGDLDLCLLRATELSLYHDDNPAEAREHLRLIRPDTLPQREKGLYRELRVRLLWSALPLAAAGLADANISCLRVDGDDLWVGTWNGGAARYSVSSGMSEVFPAPAYTRSIEVTDRRTWVGHAEGLAWYGKGTGRWSTDADFSGEAARKVQVLRLTETSGLFAGTLGDGLFRLDDRGWASVTDGGLPGGFITALAEDPARGRLLVGTMNAGLVLLDLKTGLMSTLAEHVPDFTADNITTILVASDGRVWIGTYGEGLYSWDADRNTLLRFTKAGGEIADDWILASCETDRALYFGSFGGGASAISKRDGTWRRIGIQEGLASLDVSSLGWRAPYVFFGTLGAGVCVYDEAADGSLP
jgi:hypothetical protein